MFCVLRLLLAVSALTAVTAAAQSISSAKLPPPADVKIDFNAQVKPILANKCFGCTARHNSSQG